MEGDQQLGLEIRNWNVWDHREQNDHRREERHEELEGDRGGPHNDVTLGQGSDKEAGNVVQVEPLETRQHDLAGPPDQLPKAARVKELAGQFLEHVLDGFQAQVQAWYGMGKGTDRDEIDTGFGEAPCRCQGNATGSLGLI